MLIGDHPDGPVRRLRRRAAARAGWPARYGAQAHRPGLAGRLDRSCWWRRLLPAGRRGGAVLRCWPRSSASCWAARQALSRSLFSQLIPRRQGGRVLRLLRDQRPRHQLARAARVRPDLPADRLLPARDRQPGRLLRRRRSSLLAELPIRAGDRRGRQHPTGAPVTPSPARPRRALPRPASVPASGDRRAAPGAGAPALLPRPDGLREVDAGAAGRPQPAPAGPARAAAHPGRPVGARRRSAPGSGCRRRGGRGRRAAPTCGCWSATGGPPGTRVDYLIVDEAQFLTAGAGRPAGRAGRRVRTSTSTPSG